MSKGSPSLVALLGLLAVAGYQNRDKLSGILSPTTGPATANDHPQDEGIFRLPPNNPAGDLVSGFRGLLAGNGSLATGLTELLGRFTNPVQSAKAQTWVNTGPNGALAPGDLSEVLDSETLTELADKTGLTPTEILARLSQTIPDAVNRMTPHGRLPTPEEAREIY